MRHFLTSERGASGAEYALLLAILAGAVAASAVGMGETVGGSINSSAALFADAGSPAHTGSGASSPPTAPGTDGGSSASPPSPPSPPSTPAGGGSANNGTGNNGNGQGNGNGGVGQGVGKGNAKH